MRYKLLIGIGCIVSFLVFSFAYMPFLFFVMFKLGFIDSTFDSKTIVLAPGWSPGPPENSVIYKMIEPKAALPVRVFFRPKSFLPGYKSMISISTININDITKIRANATEVKKMQWGEVVILHTGLVGAEYAMLVPSSSLLITMSDIRSIDAIVNIK